MRQNPRNEAGGDGRARILIVDDHPAVRRGLADAINATADLTVAGQAATVAEAKAALRKARPDAVLTDLSLGEQSGLELTKDLAARHPNLPVLVLSMHDEAFYAERSLRAGAKGYVMKDEALDEILGALRQVLQGRIHVSRRMAGRLLGTFVSGSPQAGPPGPASLTDRELEVFELIGRGRSTRDVAAAFHLSTKTIASHCENIKRKLGLASALELRRRAFHWVEQESGRAKAGRPAP